MFFLSIGLILILGFLSGYLLNKIKIPGLVGMIIIGLVIGPYVLNLIDESVLNISSELRQIALVIILTRSGLNLDIESLKKIGRPAILMCFIPATLEIIGVTLTSYFLLDITIFEGLLLGSVLAAVSPAVVSPRMIKLIEEGLGNNKNIPKLILAGSSVDDIFVIILFYSFLGLVNNNTFNLSLIYEIPLSIILGITLGLIIGIILSFIFKKTNFKSPVNVVILLSSSFIMIGIETLLKKYISISSLLGIIVVGIIILFTNKNKAKEISSSYNHLWTFFEIILFVLVGASVDLSFKGTNILMAIITLFIGLLFRSIGVFLSILGTNLNKKERTFVIVSYIAKATVQASIGPIALSMGLGCGNTILTISVLSILITAPLGAFLIDNLSYKLLTLDAITE